MRLPWKLSCNRNLLKKHVAEVLFELIHINTLICRFSREPFLLFDFRNKFEPIKFLTHFDAESGNN